jgi:spermidine synthase
VRDKNLGVVNKDDQNLLEFAFARGVGKHARVDLDFLDLAERLGIARPHTLTPPDPRATIEEQWNRQLLEMLPLDPPPASAPADLQPLGKIVEHLRAQRIASAYREWKKTEGELPRGYLLSLLVAYGAARANDPTFLELVDKVGSEAERELLRATYLSRSGKQTYAETVTAIERSMIALRKDPWPLAQLVEEVVALAPAVAIHDPAAARRLFAALGEPFAAEVHRMARLTARAKIGQRLGPPACVESIQVFDPPPWDPTILELRATCFRDAGDPRAAEAEHDLAAVLAEQTSFAALVPPRPAPPTPSPPPAAAPPRREADATAEPDEPALPPDPLDAAAD